MTILRGAYADGTKQAVSARESGVVVTQRFDFVVTEDLKAGDIIEIGVLPANTKFVDAVLITGAMGTGVKADAGIMSGTAGDTGSVRTVGAELFDSENVAAASVIRASLAGVFGGVAAAGSDRGIGVAFSDAVTAANQVVAVVLSYTAA